MGADKAYDGEDFVPTARELNVTPHVTKNEKARRGSIQAVFEETKTQIPKKAA